MGPGPPHGVGAQRLPAVHRHNPEQADRDAASAPAWTSRRRDELVGSFMTKSGCGVTCAAPAVVCCASMPPRSAGRRTWMQVAAAHLRGDPDPGQSGRSLQAAPGRRTGLARHEGTLSWVPLPDAAVERPGLL